MKKVIRKSMANKKKKKTKSGSPNTSQSNSEISINNSNNTNKTKKQNNERIILIPKKNTQSMSTQCTNKNISSQTRGIGVSTSSDTSNQYHSHNPTDEFWFEHDSPSPVFPQTSKLDTCVGTTTCEDHNANNTTQIQQTDTTKSLVEVQTPQMKQCCYHCLKLITVNDVGFVFLKKMPILCV